MAREDEHFRLRIPSVEKQFIREQARRNLRSMTAEINFIIRERMMSAATGTKAFETGPAAAQNTAACQGRDIINPA
ncbi:MAG: Arc family DNA-binding protein [Hyphomicrobiales bacterium]|nr:MAG: Arc family DNA-binding protein [Hyphomicrobiales bacterium]